NVAFGTVLFIAGLQIWLGLYPKVVLTTTKPVMEQLIQQKLVSANPTHVPSESLLSSHIVTLQGSNP
ncbi:MAG: hypothetical protein WA045_14720, partial [Nitrospira sp.]